MIVKYRGGHSKKEFTYRLMHVSQTFMPQVPLEEVDVPGVHLFMVYIDLHLHVPGLHLFYL